MIIQLHDLTYRYGLFFLCEIKDQYYIFKRNRGTEIPRFPRRCSLSNVQLSLSYYHILQYAFEMLNLKEIFELLLFYQLNTPLKY